jgi:hypothetical protein
MNLENSRIIKRSLVVEKKTCVHIVTNFVRKLIIINFRVYSGVMGITKSSENEGHKNILLGIKRFEIPLLHSGTRTSAEVLYIQW